MTCYFVVTQHNIVNWYTSHRVDEKAMLHCLTICKSVYSK